MEKYFVILSQGAYSDYSPNYYMGERKITQEELDKQGKEVSSKIIEYYNNLPEREHIPIYIWDDKKVEKFDPKTGMRKYKPGFDDWLPLMEQWLGDNGYSKLPDNIPEINVYYDIPN